MSDNHDLLNDKDVCSFEEHEAEKCVFQQRCRCTSKRLSNYP